MATPAELADFGRFYERTYPATLRLAYGIVGDRGLADEVTQDAYVAAFRQRDRYRRDGPVEAWLYRIVVNTAMSALRRPAIRFIDPSDPVAIDPPAGGDAYGAVVERVTISESLQRLDPRARVAVVLRYYFDLDYASIGTIIGARPGNVGAILSRSLDRLRTLIESDTARAIAPAGALPQEVGHHG